ncbi:MAG TPA: recombination mediator RecR [Pseudomonadota bacterium]|nr:recombination mediator RecR [Pseudomonadota bacterium]HNF97573.1 recombination mediator RecR [Pseudomonadota bacterium]HNI59654.1 recombination mediator RecR [Pseudomonadota bacterium]HNK45456.1 recombination mediator RecR [Pseudomonadota bacterium]HNN54464.1 recombination mediator RecR [Pseudomonadota bacterium]
MLSGTSSGDPIQRLIRELSKLPGIGQKTATRLAFFVLRSPLEQAQGLAKALVEVKERIRLCSVCMNLTESDPCELCSDPSRESRLLCVVAHPPDLLSIERTSSFRGRYHVLHGVLSPLQGIGPDDLRIRELLNRVTPPSPVEEVILATSPNVEGEATALYLSRALKAVGVRVSRIASGLPIGGDLEYADGITIARAIEVRRDM